jgi:uncharacterized membrane protein
MTRLRKPHSNLFRIAISALVSGAVSVAVLQFLTWVAHVDLSNVGRSTVISYGVAWPLNVIIYVVWSYRVYSHLGLASLKETTAADDENERRPLARVLQMRGATNTTIAAAVVAVLVTVVIAQQKEFRSEEILIVLALLTVASSWILMVFAFAQSYMRLALGGKEGSHISFRFPEPARVGDYITLALTISTSAAVISADITSRAAWLVVRTNIVIAFLFNSIIIAMMVSLVFGGLSA